MHRDEHPPSMEGLSIYKIFSRCLLLLCYALKLDDVLNSEFLLSPDSQVY